MKVKIEVVDGGRVEDCYIVIQVGEAKKQSRLLNSRIYEFPSGCKPYGKIDVFRKISSMPLCFIAGVQQHFSVPGLLGDKAGKLRITTSSEVSEPSQVRTKAKLEAARAYVQRHQVQEVLAEAMTVMIKEKPADRNAFLSSYLVRPDKLSPLYCHGEPYSTSSRVAMVTEEKRQSVNKLPPIDAKSGSLADCAPTVMHSLVENTTVCSKSEKEFEMPPMEISQLLGNGNFVVSKPVMVCSSAEGIRTPFVISQLFGDGQFSKLEEPSPIEISQLLGDGSFIVSKPAGLVKCIDNGRLDQTVSITPVEQQAGSDQPVLDINVIRADVNTLRGKALLSLGSAAVNGALAGILAGDPHDTQGRIDLCCPSRDNEVDKPESPPSDAVRKKALHSLGKAAASGALAGILVEGTHDGDARVELDRPAHDGQMDGRKLQLQAPPVTESEGALQDVMPTDAEKMLADAAEALENSQHLMQITHDEALSLPQEDRLQVIDNLRSSLIEKDRQIEDLMAMIEACEATKSQSESTDCTVAAAAASVVSWVLLACSEPCSEASTIQDISLEPIEALTTATRAEEATEAFGATEVEGKVDSADYTVAGVADAAVIGEPLACAAGAFTDESTEASTRPTTAQQDVSFGLAE
eukprot:gnl/MRDRNA2_/MRDRNA2_20270_c0_seq1.p1 gnl/MRDRNA2_/MRDRNA2_20270_c0~~gnl/MRDRNA2_/MRDRNA2_20270_c0_seq1.p1  ORF type:complete len:669 (+),score=159.76 gnl/MRDRNA2_/MRDRNA2_20270_c0_seq1:99-2009(+)